MRYLLLILLLVFGCDSPTLVELEPEGCGESSVECENGLIDYSGVCPGGNGTYCDCDGNEPDEDGDCPSGTWGGNPPEVKLIIINEDELLEKIIGDEIEIELGLDVASMPPIMSLNFEVTFDPEIFTPVNFDYEIHPNFFSTPGDPYSDLNGNGDYDEDEGEEYVDLNGNGVYDPPIPYPTGYIHIGDSSFEGGLGIADPELNGGNAWGPGRICNFYLTGTLQETFFGIDVKGAQHYIGDSEFEEISDHEIDTWDIDHTLPVASSYAPVLFLEETTVTDQSAQITLNLDDSPKLAKFKTKLTYDSSVLSFITTDGYSFFNDNYGGGALGNTNVTHNLNEEEGKGEITIEFLHDIVNNEDMEIDSLTFSTGTGSIMTINFLVFNSENSTIINLEDNDTEIWGYNSSSGDSYAFDLDFWEITESLIVGFE